jgi:hypothetical protein
MENVTSQVTGAPAAIVGVAKRRPITFILVLVAAALLILRYRGTIAGWLVKIPVIGAHLGKFIGAAVAALVFLASSPVFASAANGGCCSEPPTMWGALIAALLMAGATAGTLAFGMAWTFPVPLSTDIRSDGKIVQSFTPSTSEQSVDFKIESTKAEASGGYKRVTSLCGRLRVGFDQAASGGTAVNWDDLPRAIAGLPIDSPVFGQIIDKATSKGPYLKHMVEFFGNGGHYAEGARAQIASTDGDTAVDLFFAYPFAQKGFVRPADFMPWVGWLERTIARFTLGTTTCLDAVSTGAVIEATCNVQMWYDYVVDNGIEIGPWSHWQEHLQTAGGGSSVMLSNVGANEGLRRVEPYCRLAGLFWMTDQKGMGGCEGVDQISGVEIPKLDYTNLANVVAPIRALRYAYGDQRRNVAGVGSSPQHDGAGNPEGMGATPNYDLNSSSLMYYPLICAGPSQEISKLKKFRGDILINYTFGTAPSSGSHRHLVWEIRDITAADRVELLKMAGCTGMTRALADGNTAPDSAKLSGGKNLIGLPDRGLRG